MEDGLLQSVDQIIESGNAAGALDFLISHSRATGNPNLLFEAKLMKARLTLGLPLIQTEASSEFPDDTRAAYDRAVVNAAREAGQLALDAGDIPRAWPYFRAIGDQAAVAAAIENIQATEGLDRIIEIAFQEGVHPAKGLDLILSQYGMCRAITAFGMYPIQNGRSACIALLVRSLHAEVGDRLARAIESQEGSRPETRNIEALIQDREWLFGEYDYYVDTSHLLSVIPYCLEVTDDAILRLLHELCEYGKRLSQHFQSAGQPPFEQPFIDYGHYIGALLGLNVEEHIAHFRAKLTRDDSEEPDTAPAQVLVNLLLHAGRHEEALRVSVQHLSDAPYSLACPSILQICHLAKDYRKMRELAREKGDVLSYLAATVIAGEQPINRSIPGPGE